jgi:hypothetical protein
VAQRIEHEIHIIQPGIFENFTEMALRQISRIERRADFGSKNEIKLEPFSIF